MLSVWHVANERCIFATKPGRTQFAHLLVRVPRILNNKPDFGIRVMQREHTNDNDDNVLR